MPYEVKANGAGPWLQGQQIPDAEFEAHPHNAKFLRTGSVVKVDPAAPRDLAPAPDPARVAELNVQIAQLTAERDTLLGTPTGTEPHAPARVEVQIDRNDQPTGTESDANRAAGREVIQPTPGDVNVGTVTPVDPAAAEKTAKAKKAE